MSQPIIKIHALGEHSEPLKKDQSVGQLSVDIYHDPQALYVIAPIAGVAIKDLHISVTEDVLVIKGERLAPHEMPEENYLTKECFFGNFARSIVLPKGMDTSKIAASMEKSILTLTIPKTDYEKTKVIQVNSTDEN